MKWQLPLLSLAALPAVLAAPVETPARSVPASVASDDEVELLWGSGRWSYGSSKRDEMGVEVVEREPHGAHAEAAGDDDEVELLWGSGRWSYGSSKRDEQGAEVVEREPHVSEKSDKDEDEVELLWGSGRWSYGSSKRDEQKVEA